MLITLYNQLFIMSIVAGGLYLILKLFSAVTLKYFKASWHYYTYTSAYMFLLLPYHKLVSLLDFNQKVSNRLSLPGLSSIASLPSPSNVDFTAVVGKAERALTLNLDFLPYLLMEGTLAFLIVILIQNIRLHHRIFSVCHLTDKVQHQCILTKCKQEVGMSNRVLVYISPYVSTPFLYGVFRARIVLPKIEFTEEELQHIFRHELTHWKRHDAWLKCLMLLMNAIHWFNPLAYIARYDIDRFCELSRDESVVSSMNYDERRRYCELMLGVLWNVTGHNVKLFSAFSDKRKQLERRMNMIMKTSGLKNKKLVSMFAVVIALAFTLGGAITAYAATDNSNLDAVEKQTEALFSTDVTSVSAHTNEVFESETDTKIEGPRTTNIAPMATGDLGAGKAYSYDKQYLSKDQKVTINAEWTPTGSDIKIGLKSSSGTVTAKKVSGGIGSVTYTIKSSGDYYIYVGNPSKSAVKFDVSYIVN